MIELDILRNNLIDQNILRFCKNKFKRVWSWKNLISEENLNLLNSICNMGFSESEVWFGLSNNIDIAGDDLICPICKKNKRKFAGDKYNLVCGNCSSNQLESKISKFKNTISKRTPEEKHEIGQKIKVSQTKKYGCLAYNDQEKTSKTKFERYGDPNYNNREQCKKTCNEKYGVDYSFQSGNNKEKSKQTCINKYGVEYISQAEPVKNKREKTNIKKYGAVTYLVSDEGQAKAQMTKSNNIKIIEEANNCTLFKSLLKEYGQGWLALKLPKIYIGSHTYIDNKYLDQIIEYSNTDHSIGLTSKYEDEIEQFINDIGFKTVRNSRTIIDKELDIYIPEKKVAIEFNGIYWHSTIYKPKMYHKNKSEKCRIAKIKLLHIFEDIWINKKDLIKDIIKNALDVNEFNILANACKIKQIDLDTYNNFADQFNLSNINKIPKNLVGITYNDILIAALSYNKKDKNILITNYCFNPKYKIKNILDLIYNYLDFENLEINFDLDLFLNDDFLNYKNVLIKYINPKAFCCEGLTRTYNYKKDDRLEIYNSGYLNLIYRKVN